MPKETRSAPDPYFQPARYVVRVFSRRTRKALLNEVCDDVAKARALFRHWHEVGCRVDVIRDCGIRSEVVIENE